MRANHSDPRHVPGEILAYDHYCDLQRSSKGADSSWRTAHTAFSRRFSLAVFRLFSRGVILIGALSKGLRLPLLREFGRLRQNPPYYSASEKASGERVRVK